MCTLIEKIKQALDNKAEIFKEDLKAISSVPFYTKYQNKTRQIQSKKIAIKTAYQATRSYAMWSDFEDAQLKDSFQIIPNPLYDDQNSLSLMHLYFYKILRQIILL